MSVHSFRHWVNKLQRWSGSHRAMTALFVLLMLGVIEPIACILHCQFWMPHHTNHQQHQHLMLATAAADQLHPIVAGGRQLRWNASAENIGQGQFGMQALVEQTTICASHWNRDPNNALANAPAPFHEAVRLCLSIIMVLSICCWHRCWYQPQAPDGIYQPLVPPPIRLSHDRKQAFV